MDIHNYDQQLQRELKNLKNDSISARNKELILAFHDDIVLEGLSKPRRVLYLSKLKILARGLKKDFDQATKDDLKRLVSGIQQRENYSPWTKHTYKVVLRRMYKWLEPGKALPEKVAWISIRMSKSEKRLPAEGALLTQEEIEKLLEVAEHPRDRAFLSILWESGCRVGEIGNLALRNVQFDQYGLVLSVQGKTGSRKVRLVSSTPHLSMWVNTHPLRKQGHSPLWINVGSKCHHKAVTYNGLVKILKGLFEKAGIKKRYNPHIFRHSRATFMANHLTEFQMNQYFGWVQGSDMPSTYVHMSGREVDDAILSLNGMAKLEQKELNKPRLCPRCDTINDPDGKFCLKCGGILDLGYAMTLNEKREEADSVMNTLLQDREVQHLLATKLKAIKGL